MTGMRKKFDSALRKSHVAVLLASPLLLMSAGQAFAFEINTGDPDVEMRGLRRGIDHADAGHPGRRDREVVVEDLQTQVGEQAEPGDGVGRARIGADRGRQHRGGARLGKKEDAGQRIHALDAPASCRRCQP